MVVSNVYAQEKNFSVTESRSFNNPDGSWVIVGSALNKGNVPVQIQIGYNITNKLTGSVTTLKTSSYSTIAYPYDVVPFKFIIKRNATNQSILANEKPFVSNVTQKLVPKYSNIVVLNYISTPIGNNESLVGNITNNSPFDIRNVVLYASAHSKNGTQIDSVKTSIIPTIKPGQTIGFSAVPEPYIKSQIYSYSCVGADLQDAMSYHLFEIGQRQTVGYKIIGLATIDSIRYINVTDSLTFNVTNYYSTPGPINLMIMPQLSEKQHISVIIDSKEYENSRTVMNGKEILIDISVPQGQHKIQIIGIRKT